MISPQNFRIQTQSEQIMVRTFHYWLLIFTLRDVTHYVIHDVDHLESCYVECMLYISQCLICRW